MKVRAFTIRLTENELEIDQKSLNDFLESVSFKKSATHFVESGTSHWSVLVHYETTTKIKKEEIKQFDDMNGEQRGVFQHLRQWRAEKAEKLGLKSYMICHNSELINIAINRPNNIETLRQIKGFGNLKAEKHGDDIIALLNAI